MGSQRRRRTHHQSGLMNMLCCLKAYVEHGINLREGFFK
jgi:hypothetical protein